MLYFIKAPASGYLKLDTLFFLKHDLKLSCCKYFYGVFVLLNIIHGKSGISFKVCNVKKLKYSYKRYMY